MTFVCKYKVLLSALNKAEGEKTVCCAQEAEFFTDSQKDATSQTTELVFVRRLLNPESKYFIPYVSL